MSRYLGTFALVAVIILAAVGGAWWYATRPAAPAQQTGTTGGIFPGNSSTVTSGFQKSPSQQAAQKGALAAYQQALAQDGNYDNVKLGTTVAAGNFALQVWQGDNTAGEALLKYDPITGKWSVLDAGGGDWSVAALMKFGMDKKTALILLAGVHTAP